MVSSARVPLRLTLGGNTRQRIHGGVPHIVVLCLKVASHSMCPKGEPFPRQLGKAIATTFPHLPKRLSQANREPISDTTCRINARRRGGVEYGPSFQFLRHNDNLSLSTSVAHIKRFLSTTKHTNRSFLSKYHTKRYGSP
jgi:hypothetical protein